MEVFSVIIFLYFNIKIKKSEIEKIRIECTIHETIMRTPKGIVDDRS